MNISVVDELFKVLKMKPSLKWRQSFEHYLSTMPSYYAVVRIFYFLFLHTKFPCTCTWALPKKKYSRLIKRKMHNRREIFKSETFLYSSSHTTEEYRECFDLLWSLCDSLSVDGYPVVPGDLNGDSGNSLGEKGTKEPNERGRLLLNFADYFNVCPVNLLSV